ncbi:hypothetical protein M1271_00360 [Patescibacteria group bacterium]|nr:hypothetical protein [Patescibacteria group bacterium]
MPSSHEVAIPTPQTPLVMLNGPAGGGHASFGQDFLQWLPANIIFSTAIRKGKLKFTVYTFTDPLLGYEIERIARENFKLETHINNDADDSGDWKGLRIIWGENQIDAVNKCQKAVLGLDFMYTMMGERFPWLTRIPAYALPSIGLNVKANRALGAQMGFVLKEGEQPDPGEYLLDQIHQHDAGVKRQR